MNKISLVESNLHGTDLELDGTAEIERFTAHFSHLGFGLQGVPVPC